MSAFFFLTLLSMTCLRHASVQVETTYMALEKLKAECLAVMQAGSKLADVHEKATSFLNKRYPHLVAHLPKSLGFSLGLDFKDATFVLTAKVLKLCE